jgi:hypothetical protein
MATNDPIPFFLSDHTEEHEQPVIENDRAVLSSRLLKTSILVVRWLLSFWRSYRLELHSCSLRRLRLRPSRAEWAGSARAL